MEKIVRSHWLLPLLGAALVLGLLAGRGLPGPSLAHAQSSATITLSSDSGGAADSWLVSFTGFAAGDVLELTFLDPGNNPAAVGSDTIFYATAQDDGSGAFNFVPADWLSPLSAGTWTVMVTGEISGITATVTFDIY